MDRASSTTEWSQVCSFFLESVTFCKLDRQLSWAGCGLQDHCCAGCDGHLWSSQLLMCEHVRVSRCPYLFLPSGSLTASSPWRRSNNDKISVNKMIYRVFGVQHLSTGLSQQMQIKIDKFKAWLSSKNALYKTPSSSKHLKELLFSVSLYLSSQNPQESVRHNFVYV